VDVAADNGIDAFIDEEFRMLCGFLDILKHEKESLLADQVAPLLSIAEDKNRATVQLSRLALRRTQALSASGFGSGPAAIAAWLNQLSVDAPQRASWNRLLEIASRARELNEQNGALIRARLQHNQRALAVLAAASDQATLYGPDGQAFAGVGKRHLGSV
jgi:flagella synthesis protein FlgN